jgi:hypothetical protein
VSRLSSGANGSEQITSHNQRGRLIKLTVISHNQPLFTARKGSSWMKSRLQELCGFKVDYRLFMDEK